MVTPRSALNRIEVQAEFIVCSAGCWARVLVQIAVIIRSQLQLHAAPNHSGTGQRGYKLTI